MQIPREQASRRTVKLKQQLLLLKLSSMVPQNTIQGFPRIGLKKKKIRNVHLCPAVVLVYFASNFSNHDNYDNFNSDKGKMADSRE